MPESSRRGPPVLKQAISGAHHDHAYFQNLRRKIRWQLLVAYVTPLLVLSAFFHFEYNATVREGVDNHLKSVAENQRNTVDLFLQERVANVRGAVRLEEIALPPPESYLVKILGELRRESKTFVDLGLFNPQGRLVAYAGPHPDLEGKDYSGEVWFRKLMDQERDHYISDVYLGFRGKPHFIVAIRRTIEGQTWVVRVSVDPEQFGAFVGSSYLFQDAEAFVVNAAGRRQTFTALGPEEPAASQVPPRTPSTQISEVEVGGQTYLRAIAWLTEHEWALVVRVPEAKAYAKLSQARLILIAIILAALGVIVFVVLRSTRRLVARLEAADRAKETLRYQLFDAAKLASVGEMAAGVAHEINNPLAIIYEEASMMTDILDPQFGKQMIRDDFLERLGAIKEATLRGRAITSKLLAFARRHDINPEESDINLLIDRVLEVKKVDFSVSDIEVIKRYDTDLPTVMINRNQIDQVVLNLLNNAKDAIGNNGRIVVRTRREGDCVRFDIEDTGGGMPPEILERIFFPFFTTKSVGKGTGLGLSISYGIVEAHGGRIEVVSEVGKGTTFSVHLPLNPRGPQSRS